MADPVIKATMLFLDRATGWSETMYFAPDGSSTLQTRSNELVLARRKVLGSGSSIIGTRIKATTNPPAKGKFAYDSDGTANDGNSGTPTVQLADSVYTCVLMPYRTAAGTLRYVTLSGVPDSWLVRVASTGRFGLTQNALTKLQEYYTFLLSAPWPLRVQERDRAGTNAPRTITALVKNTDGQYQITTSAAHGYAVANKVVLTKIKGNNTGNTRGVRRVAAVIDATTFAIDSGPRADLGLVTYQVGGQVSKVEYNYVAAQSTDEPFIVSSRKRGRPSSPRRGRRSARR